ncbi:hypothetical protein DVH24_015981 [Malus domestica]|uniref:Uncharacterized protein n=1 Tax=Malus domestica TaxID=3750 RepID=A0A498JIS3_MALDO|nr:hypothetical protein DVH24_015981 [Malus domestica]
MAVGDIFLAAFLHVLLEKLASRDFLNFACQGGIDKKLMEWRKILYAIAEVLNDAEEKQLISEAVKLWLDDLKNLAYDVEDILDKISTEMLRRKLKEKQRAGISKVQSFIPKVKLLQFSMNSEIKEITQRVESSVREIGPMLLLRGTLRLSRIENVIDVEDARQTDLISKEGLNALQLEWSDKKENDKGVLVMLQPHGNLEELTINGCGGLKFSTWVGDPLFSNMMLVRLENCKNCGFLPLLGQLLFLKELYVSGMPGVESVGYEFHGNGSFSFPRL